MRIYTVASGKPLYLHVFDRFKPNPVGRVVLTNKDSQQTTIDTGKFYDRGAEFQIPESYVTSANLPATAQIQVSTGGGSFVTVDTVQITIAVISPSPGTGGGTGNSSSVLVTTGNEPRPTGDVVFWVGGSVKPINMGLNDIWFPLQVSAPDTTAPAVPTGLASSGINTTQVTISWTAPSDNVGVTGYEVRQDGTTIASPVVTTINVTGLTANTAYTFAVRAKDASGNWSAWSSNLNVTTATVPAGDTTAPSKPVFTGATGITSTGFTVNWTSPTDDVGVTGFELKKDGVVIATPGPATSFYTFTGLTSATSYSISIRARDAAGNWSIADTVSRSTASAATTRTVFGAVAPPSADIGTQTYYTDGPPTLVSANAFYSHVDNWVCKGARIWIPAGVASPPANLSLRAFKTQAVQYADSGAGGAAWDSPTQAKIIAAPVAGQWNEVLFDTPFTVRGVNIGAGAQVVWIGYNWGTSYIHSPGAATAPAVQAKDGSDVYLAGDPIEGQVTHRACNRAGGAAGKVYYSVDIIAEA
jgi:chitodextrinase